MLKVNIHEAKTHLSGILKEVEGGEEVIISKAGRPIAKIVAYRPERPRIAPPGSLATSGAWMAEDFDAPVDEVFESLGKGRE
jgi:prevent-host-death family protein